MSTDRRCSIRKCPSRFAGTYDGLGSEPIVRHLQNLGITAVELLPVHQHVDERHLVERGLVQLLGLQHTVFFAPDAEIKLATDFGDVGASVQDDGS